MFIVIYWEMRNVFRRNINDFYDTIQTSVVHVQILGINATHDDTTGATSDALLQMEEQTKVAFF